MSIVDVSSPIALQNVPPCREYGSLQWHCRLVRPQSILANDRKGYYRICTYPSRVSSVRHSKLSVAILRFSYGSTMKRSSCFSDQGFGFVSSRTLKIRAQQGEDGKQESSEEEIQAPGRTSWRTSVERANMVSRIFMAAFVWISLFFGICVVDNEMGGGQKGRQGPRQ